MSDQSREHLFNYALEISYDGGHFAGWQSQPAGDGVQDALETALCELGESVGHNGHNKNGGRRVNGAGRTDAGVHARAQVASVVLSKAWAPRRLVLAINAKLPSSISVMQAAAVTPDFHARRSALTREYRYFIWNSSRCFPHIKPYVLWRPGNYYDWALATRAARMMEGSHDFRAFCRKGDCPDVPWRVVTRSRLIKKGRLIIFQVEANAFLTNMVRIMLSNLIEIARGRYDEAWLAELLKGRADRTASGGTPSPSGLFLWRVKYPDNINWC
jgi:tRNA pseudouridine38-40 synthase